MTNLRALGHGLALAACVLMASPGVAAIGVSHAADVEVLFTPGDRIDQRIVAAIDAARAEVHVLAYTFTDRGIARALVAARRRGVSVEVIADRTQAQELPHAVLDELRTRGVDVWLDGGDGAAHNKVIVVDPASAAATTITGSYNFTRAAQLRNAENVVVFVHNREIATIYLRYVRERRAQAQR